MNGFLMSGRVLPPLVLGTESMLDRISRRRGFEGPELVMHPLSKTIQTSAFVVPAESLQTRMFGMDADRLVFARPSLSRQVKPWRQDPVFGSEKEPDMETMRKAAGRLGLGLQEGGNRRPRKAIPKPVMQRL